MVILGDQLIEENYQRPTTTRRVLLGLIVFLGLTIAVSLGLAIAFGFGFTFNGHEVASPMQISDGDALERLDMNTTELPLPMTTTEMPLPMNTTEKWQQAMRDAKRIDQLFANIGKLTSMETGKKLPSSKEE